MLLALFGWCNTDQRAKGFEEFIIAKTDSVALANFTEDPDYEGWLKSYRECPKAVKEWIKLCKERDKMIGKSLRKRSRLIHRLDSLAGRELTYSEAYNYIMEMVDTGIPDELIWLRRNIVGKWCYKEQVIAGEAYKDRLARDCPK